MAQALFWRPSKVNRGDRLDSKIGFKETPDCEPETQRGHQHRPRGQQEGASGLGLRNKNVVCE